MEKVWSCKWEIAPGDGVVHTEKFKSYRKAKEFVRKKIAEHIDVSGIVEDLKSSCNNSYTRAIAEFLTKYVEDPNFPYSEKDLPSCNPNDYEELDDDEQEYIDFYLSSDELLYIHNQYELKSNFIIDEPNDDGGDYDDIKFSYLCDGDSVIDMAFGVCSKTEWGSSAKPIMVLRVLEKATEPMLIADIIIKIEQEYDTKIERKSVGRHIEMLNELGYTIQKSRKGYVLVQDKQ